MCFLLVLTYGEVEVENRDSYIVEYGPVTHSVQVVRIKHFNGIPAEEILARMEKNKDGNNGFYLEIIPVGPDLPRPNIIAVINDTRYRPNGNQMTMNQAPSRSVWRKVTQDKLEAAAGLWDLERKYLKMHCSHVVK